MNVNAKIDKAAPLKLYMSPTQKTKFRLTLFDTNPIK